MKINFLLVIFIVGALSTSLPILTVKAQDGQNPVYIVQPGDSLGAIAARFGIPLDNLIITNNINDPNAIYAGMQLIIPGLEGITGTLNTVNIQLGDNLNQLSIRYKIPKSILIRLNRITSPLEIFETSDLIIPQQKETIADLVPIQLPNPNHGLLETALLSGTNPWLVVENNNLSGFNDFYSGDKLFLPSGPNSNPNPNLVPIINDVIIDPAVLIQGTTLTIRVHTKEPIKLHGKLDNFTLHFFQDGDNNYVAYQGIYALAEPGLSEISILAEKDSIFIYQLDQLIPIQEGNYSSEAITVDPETIDPAITQPELEQVESIVQPVTSSKYWTKPFFCPVEKPVCIKSWYGTRRSYNGGLYDNFHSGLDFGLCAPENTFNIYATASGIVTFTAPLIVRGNMTIIDHGWGIYTAIYHQSEIDVQVGDHVEPGQLIGLIGDTGRVTGPHLHYEIWVNGVQVNPYDWLENSCE